MDLFGLSPERVIARVRLTGSTARTPSQPESLLVAGVGFCLASLIVFGTVALGERWMYQNLGLTGAYLTWTVLFISVGGGVLSPLVIGAGQLARFYLLFSVAFLVYAIGWTVAYFACGPVTGEWLGSLAGTVLMALVLALAFDVLKKLAGMAFILFVANSLGYFAGSFLYSYFGGPTGMLLWGACFGLGLGLGLGRVLFAAQAPIRALLTDPFATRA